MSEHFRGQDGVIFDSGGYYVQQGVVSYEALFQRLLAFYRENDWASWYVLPDYVPVSSLSKEEVQSRVNATISVAHQFALEMPESLRHRMLPVVQGHTREQIKDCVDNYADMGATYIGFGSFGTSGDNNSINTVTKQAIQMIEFLKQQAQKHDLKVHLFGVGTPNVLPLFYDLGVDSFDSSCWSRTAGYGNVYLPFIGRKSITQRMAREIGGVAYTQARFNELKEATSHSCPFCASFETLKASRIHQMVHNLYVMLDTVDALNAGKAFVPQLIGLEEPHYKNYRKQPHIKFSAGSNDE
jgi:tRNA-guanine family transglycosylase